MSLLNEIDKTKSPQHIAIIMDGNGRWAKAKELPRVEGHRVGVDAVRKVIQAAMHASVKCVTLYAFSTENWKRPVEEIDVLMNLMVTAMSNELASFIENGIKLKCIGELSRLPIENQQKLQECIEKTAHCNNFTLMVAVSYSSKWELTEATRQIASYVKQGVLQLKDITEKIVSRCLATNNMPDPDLMIRTGGEHRISNFLLWQAAYAEFYFTDTFWPDFDEEELYKAILDFQQRERRYGKTSEQLED